MNALVTGAAGLLGTNLVRALRWDGHLVVARVSREDRDRPGFDDPGVRLLDRWSDELSRVDVIFHAGEPRVSVVDPARDSVATFSTGAMLGPGDTAGSPLGRWILEFLYTGAAGPAAGGLCLADARDIAAAMITAAESGASGDFTVAGPYVEYAEILEILEELTGRKARPNGRIELAPCRPASSRRAVAELGVTFRPVDETLRDLVLWHQSRGAAGLVA